MLLLFVNTMILSGKTLYENNKVKKCILSIFKVQIIEIARNYIEMKSKTAHNTI